MKSRSVISDEERKRFNARAVGLARFLVGEEVMAGVIAKLAIDGLDDEIKAEAVRREEAKDGAGSLKRMRLDHSRIVQCLVLEASTSFFMVILDLPEGGRDQFHVYYLKLLVEHALRHNSFEANVALNGFVVDCSAAEILRFQEFLTGNHELDEHQVGKRRRRIRKMLEQRLGEWIEVEAARPNQSRLAAEGEADQERIDRILSALVPWDARCELPDGVGHVKGVLNRNWPHLADLHSPAKVLSREEDPQLELNRIYALVEPVVHKRLSHMLGIERTLRMPRLFRRKSDGDLTEKQS